MIPIRKVFLLLFSLLFLGRQWAVGQEDYEDTYYTSYEGLAFNQVNRVFQDSEGFLWFGTRNGLSCYDGYSFQNYYHQYEDSCSLSNNDISQIDEDAHGNIWIATWGGGVSVFDKKEKSFRIYDNKSKDYTIAGDNIIRRIYCDRHDRVWLGTNAAGLQYIDLKKQSVHRIATDEGGAFSNILELPNGHFLVNTWKYLTEYRLVGDSTFEIVKKHEVYNPKIAIQLNNVEVLVGSLDGLYRYNTNTHELVLLLKVKAIEFIKKVKGLYLIGTKSGLYTWDAEKEEVQGFDQTIVANDIAHDKERDILWFSTANKGIIKRTKHDGKIKAYFTNDNLYYSLPLPQELFLSISKTKPEGLVIHDKQGKPNKHFPFDLGYYLSLIEIDYPLYAFVNHDVLHFINITTGKTVSHPFPFSLWTSSYDAKTNTLFLSKNNKVFEYKLDTATLSLTMVNEIDLRTHLDRKSEYRFASIQKDAQGNTWIAIKGVGLFRYNVVSQKLSKVLEEQTRFIEDMVLDPLRHTLWFASRQGLFSLLLASKESHNYTRHIQNKWINFIELKEDVLWLGSYEAILRYDIKNNIYDSFYDKIAFQAKLSFHSLQYDNKIYAHYETNGMLSFSESIYYTTQKDDSVYIKKLSTKDSVYHSFEEDIILPYHQNNISISFSCLDFLHQDQHVFEIRILNFDNEWKAYKEKDRMLNYGLPSGKYVFQIRLKDSKRVSSLSLEILPPLWKSTSAYIFYSIVLLVLLWLSFWLIQKREKRKNSIKEELIRIEEEKKYSKLRWRLFTDISHEIKTPLSLILSPLESYIKGKKDQTLDVETAQLVHRNAERLEELVKQLLDFRKVESNMLKLSIQQGNIVSYLRVLKESFQSLADQYEFDFSFSSNKESFLAYFDKDILERIIINLLSNAFKYTPRQGKISFILSIDEMGKSAKISVIDTGIGIEEEKQSRVFERFEGIGEVQSKKFSSNGLGLSLVKELLNLHHASIDFESKLNEGSRFEITLPINEAFYEEKSVEIITKKQTTVAIPSTDIAEEQEGWTILLAEDNQDIHHYLKAELEKHYTVHAFFNGKEAYEKVEELMPDLILSDIMMPQMNGIALCQKVKTSEVTSHIPVILLTAKGSHDDKIEGLESGADDYIKKPFRIEEIHVRIKNSIQLRQGLQQKYSKEVILEGKTIAMDSLDEQFLKKAMEVVEQYIDDNSFGLAVFCKEMNYGRTQLNNKMKALTGMSSNEFVRVIRLKKAAALIKQKVVNISEVAYMVGFSNPNYFSTCFKEMFGVSPRNYQ